MPSLAVWMEFLMSVQGVHLLLRVALSYLGAIGAYLSFSVLLQVTEKKEMSMASFQLRTADAEEDFKILLAAQVFMISGFLLYTVGGVIDSPVLLNFGRFYAVIFGLFVIAVFYRWWKRFTYRGDG